MTDEQTDINTEDSKDSSDNKSFGRDVGKLVSGTVVAQGVAVCLTPIITRIFSPEIYGIASVFTSIVSIIVVIACMRYEMAIMLPKDDKDAGAVFLLCLIILVWVSAACIPVMLIFGDAIAGLLGNSAVKDYLFLVPIAVFIDGLYMAVRCWNTRRKRFGTQAVTQALQSVSKSGLQLGIGLSGIITPSSLIIGNIIGNGIGTIILVFQAIKSDIKLIIQSFSVINIKKQLIRYKKFPLIETWGSWLNTISGALPIFILSIYFTSAEVGYYTLGYQILFLPMSLIGASIAQIFFQRASLAVHNGTLTELIISVISSLASIAIAPFAIFAACGGVLFSVVFGSVWYDAGVYAQILTVWIFLVFMTSPISTLSSVLEIQEFGLKMNALTVILRFAALVVGGIAGSIYLALVLYTLAGVMLVGYSNYYYIKSSGGKVIDVILKIKKYILMAVCFSILFAALTLCDFPDIMVLVAAGIILVIYEVYLFKTDGNIRNLIKSR